MSGGTVWTGAEDATLASLIGKGAAASQIALELGRLRSAICGRAHRKGLHFASNGTFWSANQPKKKTDKAGRALIKRFSPDEDKTILAMAADGKSGLDIGLVLNRNKSSIVKRARRLGSKLVGKDGPRPAAAPKPPKAKPVKLNSANIANKKESRANDPAFYHVAPVVAVKPLKVALVDLNADMCRFPVAGDRADTLFCGHPKEQGSYCRSHARLAYQAREDRRRVA